MDALISALNQRISSQVAKNVPTEGGIAGKPNFAEILDAKRDNQVLDKLTSQISGEKNDMKVLSAENIRVNSANIEVEQTSNFDAKQKVMDLFSSMNDDMNNLESAVEVLSNPDSKFSRKQLLAYQAGIGQFSLTIDFSGKMVSAAATSIQQIMNTNIG